MASRRLRVVFLSFDFTEYSVPIANALARDVDVCLLLPSAAAASVAPTLDRRVGLVPFSKPRLRQPFGQSRMCVSLARAIRSFGPDVLHLQQGHLWFNLALPLLGRLPIVATIHDHRHHLGDRPSQKTPQRVMNLAFRRADRVIVHSGRLKEEVVRELGLPAETVHVVPHVALDADGPSAGASEGHPRMLNVLFFGRIWPYKGLEYLIRAEPLIASVVPTARVVIAGAGEDFARYRALMANPDRFVVINEFVSNARRAELFAESAVVVLPYVDASQSGVVPLAYAFEKPVVVTSVGGLPDLVDDGRTGFVVPPRDERALADAVVKLLRSASLRRQLGSNGRRKLIAECSPGAVAAQTLQVYELAVRDVRLRGREGYAA